VIEGEAYAVRALCHFEVLRLFGQVPVGSQSVRLPFTDDVSREPSRYYNYADYVRLIEADLAKAEALLYAHDPFVKYTVDEVNGSGTSGTSIDPFLQYRQLRLNYLAVKALQARFYLYTGKTAEAYAAASAVIQAADNGKGFNLAGDANFTATYYALPGEGLFMLSNHQLTNYISSLFKGNVAVDVNLYMSAARMEGSGSVFGLFGESYVSTTNNRFQLLWERKTSTAGLVFELLKYNQRNATSLSSLNLLLNKQVMPMLRLSEMYLIAMETSNDLDEINRLYDPYRIARNIPSVTFTTAQEVMDVIEKEYRREFFGEGQMFAFYKRHNATKMVWSDRTISEADYIIPLPTTEFDPNR
jgi:hypothetical protein